MDSQLTAASYELFAIWQQNRMQVSLFFTEEPECGLSKLKKDHAFNQLQEKGPAELALLSRLYRPNNSAIQQIYRRKINYTREGRIQSFLSLQFSKKGPVPFESEVFAYHPETFFEKNLKDHPWHSTFFGEEDSSPSWPVPQGELPVYWSPSATATLIFPFMQMLEADRFAQSPFSLEEKFALPFSIHEWAPFETITQGTLFDGTQIQRLLSVETGHLRQNNNRDVPVISIWNPEIEGQIRKTDPLQELPFGIAIEKIDLHFLYPDSVQFSVPLSYLIHQGKKGEQLAPFLFEYSWIELLKSFECFSRETFSVTLSNQKKGVNIPVPILTPSAISRCLPINGTVPPSHYW